jgi:hypothetical protein
MHAILFVKINFAVPSTEDACFPFLLRLIKKEPILPTPGEAKAKAMPGRLYIHTK